MADVCVHEYCEGVISIAHNFKYKYWQHCIVLVINTDSYNVPPNMILVVYHTMYIVICDFNKLTILYIHVHISLLLL